jgi:hypothetical protein
MATLRSCILLIPLFATALLSDDAIYRSVRVDNEGRLHIIPESGKEILRNKSRGQTSFDDPKISPDGRTVGWIGGYRNPNGPDFADIALELVVFRAGRILHRFDSEFFYWDWEFQDGGKRIAYSFGPQHGGATGCVLREVLSGRVIARWEVHEGSKPPDWAKELDR